ncbi:hypothetical protein EGR_06525 [Echinococcus granulosus]|uniref:Uncharacterized protein n=1 Tax=Echinococcus granulosus TaxID=6210 RepID=W6UKM9_ECHGR|nr:hypothetical protein EGR_06525 [Echinococcus granulosus]EUB58642.1 hypothetical protein EGR_06525 [Echinococcus granulosus]
MKALQVSFVNGVFTAEEKCYENKPILHTQNSLNGKNISRIRGTYNKLDHMCQTSLVQHKFAYLGTAYSISEKELMLKLSQYVDCEPPQMKTQEEDKLHCFFSTISEERSDVDTACDCIGYQPKGIRTNKMAILDLFCVQHSTILKAEKLVNLGLAKHFILVSSSLQCKSKAVFQETMLLSTAGKYYWTFQAKICKISGSPFYFQRDSASLFWQKVLRTRAVAANVMDGSSRKGLKGKALEIQKKESEKSIQGRFLEVSKNLQTQQLTLCKSPTVGEVVGSVIIPFKLVIRRFQKLSRYTMPNTLLFFVKSNDPGYYASMTSYQLSTELLIPERIVILQFAKRGIYIIHTIHFTAPILCICADRDKPFKINSTSLSFKSLQKDTLFNKKMNFHCKCNWEKTFLLLIFQ